MPKVSVIIPTYNNAKFLGEAIESILSQTYKGYEVIVVNDGSTDDTLKVIEEFKGSITYFEKENRGPSSARNLGLRHAKGEFIAFLDADDLYLPTKLELQVNYLETHPEIGVVYSDGYRMKSDTKGKSTYLKLSQSGELLKSFTSSIDLFHKLMNQNVFPINNALTRKKCIDSVEGFDETLSACEDWDLWFRIAEKFNISYLDGDVAVYRVTPKSNSTDLIRNYRQIEKVLKKIKDSQFFEKSPAQTQQQFYYHQGIIALAVENPQFAIDCFHKALSFPPKRVDALFALLLSQWFGKNAFKFYLLKRILFGLRGIRKL